MFKVNHRWFFVLLLFTAQMRLEAGFRAGVATRIVTPDPLLPVSGGVGASHPTTRKCGDLTVRALVLENGATKIAVASVDFLGFPAVLGNRVKARFPAIPPGNILIGATHTHSAPDCYGFPDEQGKTSADLAYLDWVCNRMVEALQEANAGLVAAKLKIGTGKAQGKIAYNYYAPELYDRRCDVIQAVDDANKPIATLVNYAIHPEVLGSDQGILSPDMVGPLYDRLLEKGGGVGVFMNSAQGGMVTADCRGPAGRDVQTWEECQRIGKLLADEALRIVSTASIQENPTLLCASKKITFPVDSPLMLAIMKSSPLGYGSSQKPEIETLLSLVNIGDSQILTIPGEALPNLGFYLKRKMRGQHNLLFGLTHDAFGYILVKEDWNSFDRYAYITRTGLGERTGEVLETEALKLIADSPAPK